MWLSRRRCRGRLGLRLRGERHHTLFGAACGSGGARQKWLRRGGGGFGRVASLSTAIRLDLLRPWTRFCPSLRVPRPLSRESRMITPAVVLSVTVGWSGDGGTEASPPIYPPYQYQWQ